MSVPTPVDSETDPFRPTEDYRIHLPLHALDPAPWNPKDKIHGQYRKSLTKSLETFSLRDDLKVWENPRNRGRYFVLNGNQRLDILCETSIRKQESIELDRIETELGIATVDPENQSEIKKLKTKAVEIYESNENLKSQVRSRAMNETIECRVLTNLDPDDAKLFTATFDRNHAVYNEHKLADLAEEIESRRTKTQEMINLLLRPNRPFISPLQLPVGTLNRTQAEKDKAEFDSKVATAAANVSEEKPWGDPPPSPPQTIGLQVAKSGPPPQLIPVMFSLTPDGYERLTTGVIKSKSRAFRESQLLTAIERLAEFDPDEPSDDVVVEIALRVINDRASILKERQERSHE